MFGLPYKPSTDPTIKKESRFKNVCSGYLFELEDKKYQSDKMISTLKVIQSKLNKDESLSFLSKIEIIKKDMELYEILDGNFPKKQKM